MICRIALSMIYRTQPTALCTLLCQTHRHTPEVYIAGIFRFSLQNTCHPEIRYSKCYLMIADARETSAKSYIASSMLASSSTRILTRRSGALHRLHPQQDAFRKQNKRTLVSSTLQTLGEGFLDLAIAIPYPQSLPPYSGTIILVTVASRLFLTVPFSIWVRRSLSCLFVIC